jgi:hypothetical protein
MQFLRVILLSMIVFGMSLLSRAQISIENLFGAYGNEFSAICVPDLSATNLSYYGNLDIELMYDSIGKSQFSYYHTLSYEVIKNAGFTVGNSFLNDDVMPHVGLYWEYENKSTDISVFSVFVYSVNYGIIGMDTELYFEKFWTKGKLWYPYSLIMVNGNFFNDGYWETSVHGCLGVSYRKQFQFGFGSSFFYSSEDDNPFFNPGIFLSYGFD